MSVTNASIPVRLRALISRSASNQCTPPEEEIWFPVAPTVTALPPVPAETVNPETIPADSAMLPVDFDVDDPDLCALFTSILSESNDPVYERELNVASLVLPYNETIVHTALLRTYLNLYRYHYSLKPRQQDAFITNRIKYYIVRLYKFKKTQVAYSITGKDAAVRKTWVLTAQKGTFSVVAPDTVIRPVRIFGETGSVAVNFASALVAVPGTFSYGWSSTTNTGTAANPISIEYRRIIHQTLYTAAILSANGARSGARFVNLRWYVTSAIPASNSILGMNIKIFHTDSTASSGYFTAKTGTSKVTVYSDSATTEFTKAESLGVLQIDFTTEFQWDGVSSIVVESCTSQNQTNYGVFGGLRNFTSSSLNVRRYYWVDSSGSSCNTDAGYAGVNYIATQMDFI